MLKLMRDYVKYLAWTLWVVIAVFILFVFVDFGGGVPRGSIPTRSAATVGSHEISYQAFQREYRNLEEQMRRQLGDSFTPEMARERIPVQALGRLVSQEILLQEARDLGLTVTDDQVREYILSIPGFTDAEGRFVGPDAYQRVVRYLGYSAEGFEDAIRREILIAHLNAALERSVFVPDLEVERRYRELVERASIRFVELPYSELRGESIVSDEEVERYYEAHSEDYRLAERRVVDYLLVDQNKLRAEVEVKPDELRRFYDENLEDFTQQEQVRARHILVRVDEGRTAEEAERELREARQRIEAGEDFAALAEELSDDPGSAQRGGDLGFFDRGRMDPVFEERAFSAPIGEVVGPFRSSFGVHLLEVTQRREERVRPYEEVEGLVRTRLQGERSVELAESRARQLHEDIVQQQLSTQEQLEELAAAQETVTLTRTSPFGRNDSVPGIGRAPEFLQVAFDLGVGEVSQPVRLPRGWAVVSLVEILDPRLPALEEIRSEVREAALQETAKTLALDRLRSARERVVAGSDLQTIAEELGLQLKESGEFGHGGLIAGLGSSPAVTEAALGLKAGKLGGPVALARSAVLFEVLDRRGWDSEEFSRQRDELRAQLQQREVQRLLATVVDQRRRELGVSYDRQLLESLDLSEEQT